MQARIQMSEDRFQKKRMVHLGRRSCEFGSRLLFRHAWRRILLAAAHRVAVSLQRVLHGGTDSGRSWSQKYAVILAVFSFFEESKDCAFRCTRRVASFRRGFVPRLPLRNGASPLEASGQHHHPPVDPTAGRSHPNWQRPHHATNAHDQRQL